MNPSVVYPLSGLSVETVTERIGKHILASTVRAATQRDVDNAARLHAKGHCSHNVVKDTAGWLYDTRVCATCGEGLGTI